MLAFFAGLVVVPYMHILTFGAGPLLCTSMRYNLRTQAGAGLPMADNWGVVGDVVMMMCCPCFTVPQLIRSAGTREAWDWVQELQTKGFKCYERPCIFFRPIA